MTAILKFKQKFRMPYRLFREEGSCKQDYGEKSLTHPFVSFFRASEHLGIIGNYNTGFRTAKILLTFEGRRSNMNPQIFEIKQFKVLVSIVFFANKNN